jgi:hypothetical protein
MTDLPPYPGGTGTAAANRLRQMLRQIDLAWIWFLSLPLASAR